MGTFSLLGITLITLLTSCASRPANQKSAILPRIGVRTSNAVAEFYVKETVQRFTPQGVNWVRLAISEEKWPPNISFNDSYFIPHEREILSAIRDMAKLGYNVIRVRLDAKGITGPKDRIELNSSYVHNLVTFLREANANGLYVELTGQWLPDNYYKIAFADPKLQPNSQASGINQLLLSRTLIKAFGQYEADVISAIKKEAPESITGIFALDLWNELSFSAKEAPFSKASGVFLSETEKTYDLSSPLSRQELADDWTLQWVNGAVSAIKNVDPEVLITSSVFTLLEVKRTGYEGVYTSGSAWGDWRQPFRLKILEQSNVDFLQLHPYPHNMNYKLKPDLQSVEYFQLKRTKPIIIGEFGAHKKDFPKIEDASRVLKYYLSDACQNGFSGWVFWSWDMYQDQIHMKENLWNLTDNNNFLANELSPKKLNWCSVAK